MMRCPKDGLLLIAVEYGPFSTEHYDGISEWDCGACDYRIGRWTKLEIPDGFIESRWGERGHVPIEGTEPA